jgi:hypothetical protein
MLLQERKNLLLIVLWLAEFNVWNEIVINVFLDPKDLCYGQS